jgi:hypothetical protein
MKRNYYYLATSLPTIEIGKPLEFRFRDLRHFLRENLSLSDLKQTWTIRRYYDVQNIRALWLEYPLSNYGNLNPVELEDAVVTKTELPPYILDFLDRYPSLEDRLRYFPLLVRSYFLEESAKAQGFLKEYLTFEREWRLVVAAFRAKRLGRDFAVEFQFEDPYEELIAQILAQKDAKNFDPPEPYALLKPLFERYVHSPIELHQALCQWRYDAIEEMLGVDMVSIERVLGYLAQFIIAERWLDLDQQKGMQVIDIITQDVG